MEFLNEEYVSLEQVLTTIFVLWIVDNPRMHSLQTQMLISLLVPFRKYVDEAFCFWSTYFAIQIFSILEVVSHLSHEQSAYRYLYEGYAICIFDRNKYNIKS